MLVLSRKSGESVTIGQARVTVYNENGRIRLAIEAPRDVLVLRDDMRCSQPRTFQQQESGR